jgi:geranylgeranyl diphosphate synthase type 3
MASKSYCEDLTEGKFSFPIIYAVHKRPDDTRLLNILRQKSDEISIKQHAVQWMHQCGSFEYTRQVLRKHKDNVLKEIESLGGHERLAQLVEYLDHKMDDEDCILGVKKTSDSSAA